MTTAYAELQDRYQESVVRARVLCARSTTAARSSAALQAKARHVRDASMRARALRRPELAPVATDMRFVVRGLVDGLPSVARWGPDSGLDADPEVCRRAELVVALGESFDNGSGSGPVVASLDGSMSAALLAVVRAFSRVTTLDLVAPEHRTS